VSLFVDSQFFSIDMHKEEEKKLGEDVAPTNKEIPPETSTPRVDEFSHKISFFQALGESYNREPLLKLIATSILMFTLPVFTIITILNYGSYWIPDENDRYTYGGFAALLVLILIMAGYVTLAFLEDIEEPNLSLKNRSLQEKKVE